MTADLLREAAQTMNHDWDMARDMEGITLTDPHWRRAKAWLAVADLLNTEAAFDETLKAHGARGLADDDPAYIIARAYLGRDS